MRTKLRWLTQKARDLASLELELAKARELTARGRVQLFSSRYHAIATRRSSLAYLGHPFHYDNRLMPALMPSYLTDIRTLRRFVDLERALILDIGANVGQFAATVIWQFPEARIWSFEPNREIYPTLERNAAGSQGWHTVPLGVAEREAEIAFWVVPGKSGQGSVLRDNATANLGGAHAEERRIQVGPLTSERLASLGIPDVVDLIKIDVEGAEADALAGLRGISWRYMAIEASQARAGGITVEQAVELASSLWGRRPIVRWTSSAAREAPTVDAILEMPSAAM